MAVKVYPGAKGATHQISLSDGVRTYGLRLADGSRSIQEIPMTPSTIHFSGGGTKFGDWEPGMSHIEQRTWEGGRAQKDFVDDPTRFFDSKNAWTLTPGKVFPTPAWKFSDPNDLFTEGYQNLPGDMGWRSLYGDYDQIAEIVDHSSGWATFDSFWIWVRRIGTPGTLGIVLHDNLGSQPGVSIDSDTLTASEVNENEVYLIKFSVTGTCIGSDTLCKIAGSDTDDAANHWEIGVDIDGGTAKYQASGIWQNAAFSIYYRFLSANVARKWHFFEYMHALYAVDECADGTAASLLLNGDRGKATSSTSTVITNTNASMTADAYIGAWVKITSGTGIGQQREITDNTSTTITTAAWDITPDSTSEYIIYHTDIWQDISPSSGDVFDAPVKDVLVVDDHVHFAMGDDDVTLKMRWNPGASPPAHEYDDDGTVHADFLALTIDETNDVQVYRFRTSVGSYCFCERAAVTAWATDSTYSNQVKIGNENDKLINIHVHDGKLYAFKTDGRYEIKATDTAIKSLSEIGFIKNYNNGQALLSHGLYSYFSWGNYALQRLYDASGTYDLSNIGPDKDEGLADDRKGPIVSLAGSPPGILAAVDGGDSNYSSVLVMPVNGYGWHEVLRGYAPGARIQSIYFQDSYRPRLWCDMGGELVYMDWPLHSFNPLKDSEITYMPEAHLITSTIDMGVSNLPKFIESMTATVENLGSGIEVQLDYQTNEDVGTHNWIFAGTFQVNPFDTIEINQGEVYQIRFRLRLYTNVETTPPVINATVMEGYARTPIKYQWNMRLKISSTQRDMSGIGKDSDPDEFFSWLKECAKSSKRVFMRAIWEQMDSKYVIVEPPTLLRSFTNKVLGFWGGQVQITVREK